MLTGLVWLRLAEWFMLAWLVNDFLERSPIHSHDKYTIPNSHHTIIKASITPKKSRMKNHPPHTRSKGLISHSTTSTYPGYEQVTFRLLNILT